MGGLKPPVLPVAVLVITDFFHQASRTELVKFPQHWVSNISAVCLGSGMRC